MDPEYDRTDSGMFCNNTVHPSSNVSCVRVVVLAYEEPVEACVKTKCECCAMLQVENTCFGRTYALIASCHQAALAQKVKFEFEFVFELRQD